MAVSPTTLCALASRPLHDDSPWQSAFDFYGSNMPLYPAWQNLLKSLNVPVEVIWGSHDNYFTVPGALAYLRDAPKAEIPILDAGHFATLEDPDAIATLVAEFTSRHDLR